jgi:hypothetical protein
MNISYPQVIGELLRLLNCTLDIAGCHQAAKMICSQEVEKIRIKEGPCKGCYDGKEIDRQIGNAVLRQYPQLQPMVDQYIDECEGFYGIAVQLNDFIEVVAYLSGNRSLPTDDYSFVKGEKGYGMIMFKEEGGCYIIRSRTNEASPIETRTYQTAFEMAMDGWRID